MRITADTNLLVRAVTEDDPKQARLAQAELRKAELVAITLPTLCELVWVLDRFYRIPRPEIASALRTMLAADNVATDMPGVTAGLAMLDGGGDFADGVIAHAGRWLGGETFVSFDKQAVELLVAQGEKARLLG